jgi:hypothetical protein
MSTMHSIVKGGHQTQEIKKQETSGAAVPRYWDPFAEMPAEMDRVFNSFLGRGLIGGPSLPRMTMPEVVTPDNRCSRERQRNRL